MHPECYDEDARALLRGQRFAVRVRRAASTSPTSRSPRRSTSRSGRRSSSPRAACAKPGGCSITCAATIGDSRNTVVIVGFQAQHTLGRRLVERRPEVRIFGVERRRRAEVVVLDGFSRARRPERPARVRRGRPRARAAAAGHAGSRRAARPGGAGARARGARVPVGERARARRAAAALNRARASGRTQRLRAADESVPKVRDGAEQRVANGADQMARPSQLRATWHRDASCSSHPSP